MSKNFWERIENGSSNCLEVWSLFMQMKSCSIERRQKWYSIPRPCNWLKMMECSIINSSVEPATVKQIVPLIGRAGRPTQIMFYISKERLKEIFYSAKEKYALKANFFKTPMESRWLGYPAHSHHDIFPPWWVFFRDDNGGNLAGHKIPP